MRERSTTRRQFGAAAFLSLSLIAACGSSTAQSSKVLRFSAIPDQATTELRERYARVAEYLAERLGIGVEYWHASDYTASVEAFKNGDVQLAWFGGVTGVRARLAVTGAHAIAQGQIDTQFKSYFVANADTGILPSDDFPMAMEGKSFTFGERESTSGRVMPEFYIREATGKSPEEFFGSPPAFSGKHNLTAKQVESGAVQCGALNYEVYDSMVAKGELDPARCVRVWTTPTYPDYQWTAHPELEAMFGAGFTKKLQDVLVGIADPEILKALGRPDGLIPAQDSDYAQIAQVMQQIGRL